jgi:hypothetical protein
MPFVNKRKYFILANVFGIGNRRYQMIRPIIGLLHNNIVNCKVKEVKYEYETDNLVLLGQSGLMSLRLIRQRTVIFSLPLLKFSTVQICYYA